MTILKKLFGKKKGGCCKVNLDEEIAKVKKTEAQKEKTGSCCKK